MPDDTRVALVREDTARERIKKALNFETALQRWLDSNQGEVEATLIADVEADLLMAELFPETDKPLRVGHIKTAQIALDDRAYRALWGDHADPKPDEANARIEEELNRGSPG